MRVFRFLFLCKKYLPAWSVETRRAASRRCRDGRVYGHTTTTTYHMSTSAAPPSLMCNLSCFPPCFLYYSSNVCTSNVSLLERVLAWHSNSVRCGTIRPAHVVRCILCASLHRMTLGDVPFRHLSLSYVVIPRYLALPYLALPYLTSPYLTHLSLPDPTLPYLTLPCLTLRFGLCLSCPTALPFVTF